ncbi:hypothetical protein Cs7R123_34150 [Catellatospora sp. TT07R-123]|uniref:DUF4276 family protein n=1 Tax=Catellatospora sp. TT07R-123 TaxID=2733863 RepID=UPI001B267F88|nr:DUF4276 family protein [Catellatospora sp. TT07R-123]GHJ46073.1 hypothetical protein Cs7R123_34150 [Catellatospora sp. TT07R-123]
MRRVHVLIEGQTEELVLRDLLLPYLEGLQIQASYNILITRRQGSAPAGRGGVSSWNRIEPMLRHLLRDPTLDRVTTIFDYYAFPSDAPGMRERARQRDPYSAVRYVETELAAAIGDRRFVPFLVLHEIEAWVLSSMRAHAEPLALRVAIQNMVDQAGGPELVNGSQQTAPSKRLERLFERHLRRKYLKTTDGPASLRGHSVEALRADCPHFDQWLTTLTTPEPS